MENQQQNEELKKQAEIEKEERMRVETRAKAEEEIKARKEKEERKKGGLVLLVILGIIFIVVLVSLGGGKDEKNNSEVSEVGYEAVEAWKIPNGGYGGRIIISAKFQDKDGLKLICDSIERVTKNDRNAFFLGFKDMESLLTNKNVPVKNNKGFILNFEKNGNTGYHNCTIYDNDHTEIETIEY